MSEHDLDEEMREKSTKEEKEKKLIQRYYQQFSHAEQAVSGKRESWKILDMFDRGEQWKDTSLPPWVPKPVTNYVRYVRTLKRANLASAIPMAHYSAELGEDSEIISKMDKAYRHVWEKEKIPRTVRRCIDRALLQGTAIAYVYTDDTYIGGKYYTEGDARNKLFQGKVCVKRIPNANFFIDPDAYYIDDAKWVEFTELLPMSDILNNPRFVEHTKGKLKKIQPKTGFMEMSDESSGTIYDREHKPSQGQPATDGDEMATLHVRFERRMVKGGKYKMNVSYYLRDLDFFLLQIEDIQPNRMYPFAVLYDEEEENDFWGTSTIMDFLENQKVINKTSQVSAMIAVLHQNPQKFVSRESGINAQEMARSSTMPGKVWTTNGDPKQAVHVQEPMDIPKGLFDVDSRLKQDIREMAGINEAYTGQSVGSLTTSSGVNSLIERATIRDKDKMIQIDEFVERISDLICLHILYKWKDKTPISYTGADSIPIHDEYAPVDKLTADNLEWRVKADLYAKAPSTVASRKQQADNLMQMQGQFGFSPAVITPEEWIQFQDFDMKDQILQRMQRDRARMEQEKPDKLAQQIFQVAQELQKALSSGMPPQEAMNLVTQRTKEIVAQQQQAEMNGKATPTQQPGLPQENAGSAPAPTGQLAMAAQARGR